MTKPNIFIHMPTYSGKLCRPTADSLTKFFFMCDKMGIPVTMPEMTGDSLVTRARDRVWHSFLKTTCTHQLFIDDDITFEPVDALRLVQSGLDFTAGIYPLKSEEEKYVCSLVEPQPDDAPPHPMAGRWREAYLVGTGFMCMTRAACERITDAYAHRWYLNNAMDIEGQFQIFEIGPGPKRLYLSEDYALVQKWRELGGRVWVDPTIKLSHTGIRTWKGDYGSWLANHEAAR